VTTGSPAATSASATAVLEAADYLSQGITVFDAGLTLVAWNRRFSELFGFPDGALAVGMPFDALIRFNACRGEYGPCEVEEQVRWRVERAQRFEPHRFERRRPDGTWLEIVGNPLPQGGFVTTYTDVSERVRAAEALREANAQLDRKVSERTAELARLNQVLVRENARRRQLAEEATRQSDLLRIVIEHLPQGISVFDAELTLTIANARLSDLTGVPPELCRPGTPFADFIRWNAEHGEYGAGDVEQMVQDRVERAKLMRPHVMERMRPDGRALEIRGNPLPGGGFISTFTDTTDRRHAEAALREREATIHAMLESPGLILYVLDRDGRVVDCNTAAAEKLDRSKDQALGRSLTELLEPEVAERRLAWMEMARTAHSPVRFEDYRRGRWMETVVSPIVDDDGSCVRMVVAAHDVTHRKENEKQLLEAKAIAEMANRAKTEFLANMSHELRTPLNAIIGFSDVLAEEMFGPIGLPRYREYANDIRSSGRHLLALINDILDISRIEIGAVDLSESPLDPSALVWSCMRLVHERATNSGVELHQSLDADLPLLYGDERRLKQVLINLLANAVKFTPSGGRVTISAHRATDGFIFAVADTGIGMSEDDIELALKPFGQVDTGLDRKYEGAGLGLPLAKALADLHDGRLDISSVPDKGTTVTIHLPRRRVLEAEDEFSVAG
jgi:two-component system cell cycle sensor histidine kinase PleC